jgi:glycosyltransferase involved in cell wall biosynthesis
MAVKHVPIRREPPESVPERPLRVALVYRDFSLAGSIERHSVILARALVGLGAEVHCYCNVAASNADMPGVVLHDVRPLVRSRSRLGYAVECLSFAVRATRAIRRDQPHYDLVHVNGTAGWRYDVVTVHGVSKALRRRWPTQGGASYRAARLRAALAPVVRPKGAVVSAIERLQFRRVGGRRVIAVTDEVRRDLEDVHGIPSAAISVVPLPLTFAPSAVRPAGVRAMFDIPAEAPILVFVGHSFERKALADLVGALAGLDPAAHVVVVGNGKRAVYEARAEKLGVAHRLHFVGGDDSPERYLAEADVFVLPTRQEPWGMTIIEAMALGVPVVTTSVAGAAAEVERADAGIVLDDAAPEALRAALSGLLRDPERRREMGARGRKASERFTAQAFARAFLDACAPILDPRRGGKVR